MSDMNPRDPTLLALESREAGYKKRIEELESNERAYEKIIGPMTYREVADRIRDLKSVVDWVDSWVSNPVGSYSVYSLDGLFRMTREKIADLKPKNSAK